MDRAVPLLTALIVAAAPWVARAQGSRASGERAALWDQAMTAIEAGDLEGAEAALSRSYQVRDDGAVACQLGRLLRRQSRLVEAETWLSRCARDSRLSPAERQRAEGEAQRVRSLLGRVTLQNLPEGATVQLEGQAAALDLSGGPELTLPPGAHRLVITEPGATAATTREVSLGAGQALALDLSQPAGGEEPSARTAPAWSLWVTLSTSLALFAGAGVVFGYDISLAQTPDRSETLHWVGGMLAGFAGAALAAALILIPYVRAARRSRRSEGSARALAVAP